MILTFFDSLCHPMSKKLDHLHLKQLLIVCTYCHFVNFMVDLVVVLLLLLSFFGMEEFLYCYIWLLSLYFFVSFIDFGFVVTMKFIYNILSIQQSLLSCQLFKFKHSLKKLLFVPYIPSNMLSYLHIFTHNFLTFNYGFFFLKFPSFLKDNFSRYVILGICCFLLIAF